MNIQKLKHNRTFMTVLQGLLLLVILSTLFSVCINLLVTGFSDDVSALNEQIASEQAGAGDGHEQQAAESLEVLNEATVELEQYRSETGSLKLLAVIMYAAFALLFLLKSLITRDSWRLNQFRYGIGGLFFAACAAGFLFADPLTARILAVSFHAAALAVDHVFSIVRNHKVRNVIPRVLFILILLVITAYAFVLGGSIALLCLLFFTAEILFGMLMLIVAFSIVLPQFESGIPSFEDALWYCFAIVTTIGFGDFTAVTLPGRIISVVLGLYGIIVVALVTSIIVNFYNETKNTADPDETETAEQ